MYKKFEINRTKIKGGCRSGRKVTHNSKSDLPGYTHNKEKNVGSGAIQRLPKQKLTFALKHELKRFFSSRLILGQNCMIAFQTGFVSDTSWLKLTVTANLTTKF